MTLPNIKQYVVRRRVIVVAILLVGLVVFFTFADMGLFVRFLLQYKYAALFGITFIAAFFLPIPPGTIIMASAAFAFQGYLDIVWVLVVAILGNIAGDNAGYWVARRYGRELLIRIGFRSVLESQRYRNIEARVVRRPGLIIFLSRFEVFANLAVNLIAGLGKVSYRKFLLFEIIGETFQVVLYGMIGYFFGSNWEAISSTIGKGLLGGIVLVVILLVLFRKKLTSS